MNKIDTVIFNISFQNSFSSKYQILAPSACLYQPVEKSSSEMFPITPDNSQLDICPQQTNKHVNKIKQPLDVTSQQLTCIKPR